MGARLRLATALGMARTRYVGWFALFELACGSDPAGDDASTTGAEAETASSLDPSGDPSAGPTASSAEEKVTPQLFLIDVMDMWDFNSQATVFFLNFASIMGLYISLSHYVSLWLRRNADRPRKK